MPEQYRMKWLCDLDQEKIKKGTAEYGGIGTVNFEDLLNDPEVELVTIATPVATHVSLAKQALKAGKHVLVEKPIAVSVEEADDLIAFAKNCRGALCIDHERRFFANQKAVCQAVEKGQLGSLLSVQLDLPLSNVIDGNQIPAPNTWKQRFLKSHIYDYLVHHVDQICMLLDEKPTKVYGRSQALSGQDLPCELEISLTMPSGILASVNMRYSHAPDLKWALNGEKGSLRMQFSNDMGPCFIYEPLPERARKVSELSPSCTSQDAFMEFYRDLYRAIREGAPVPASAADARDAIRIIWLAMESASTGRVLEF
jgi:scyllo-inositol 2-dehydrogenase (NADP+)